MAGRDLYTYRCSFCQTTGIATFRATPTMPLNCPQCLRIMALLYAQPVGEAEWQARNLTPPVFRSRHETGVVAQVPCEFCRRRVPKDSLIVLPCVGKFCSEDCAQAGVVRHQQYMERQTVEAEQAHAAELEKWKPKHRPMVEKAS